MPLLNWLNKDEATKAAAKSAYRLLEERTELSYGDSDTENLIIQGDNRWRNLSNLNSET